jgi:Spy/CpxP family protein refolding chaperone
MSFKRKFISTVSLALAVGTFSTFVAAQDSTTTTQTDSTKKERKFERRADGLRGEGKGMRGGKHGGDRMLMGALRRLNLTDAQKEQIKTIHENNKPNQALHEEMRGLAQKRRDGGSLTEQELTRLKEIRNQMQASAEQTHKAVLAVLTDEQRTQLQQMKQGKGERRGGFKGMKRDAQTPSKPTGN